MTSIYPNYTRSTLIKAESIPSPIESRSIDISMWIPATFSVRTAEEITTQKEIQVEMESFKRFLTTFPTRFSTDSVKQTAALQKKIEQLDQWTAKIDGVTNKIVNFKLARLRLQLQFLRQEASQTLSFCSEKLFERAYSSLAKDAFWKVFIDSKDHHLGGRAFESTEAGYFRASMSAFEYIKQTMGHRVDAEFLIDLHSKFTHGISRKSAIYEQEGIQRGFHAQAYYGIVENEMNPGIKELSEKGLVLDTRDLTFDGAIDRQKTKNYLSIIGTTILDGYVVTNFSEHPKNFSGFNEKCLTNEQVNQWVNQLCAEYYSTIDTANTPEEKLKAICQLCVKLAIFHLFEDGNGRTVKFGLLPKLLIENGFSPTILTNPPLAFGHRIASQQLLSDVHEGMVNFQKACRGEPAAVPAQQSCSSKLVVREMDKLKRPAQLNIWPQTIQFRRGADTTLETLSPPVGYKRTGYGFCLVTTPLKTPPDSSFWDLYFEP